MHSEPIAFKSGLLQTIYSYRNSNITAQKPTVQWVFRQFSINIQKQTTLMSLFSGTIQLQTVKVMDAILLHQFQLVLSIPALPHVKQGV